MIFAAVLGVVAVLSLFLAAGTVGKDARQAVWTPAKVGTVVHELSDLRRKATG